MMLLLLLFQKEVVLGRFVCVVVDASNETQCNKSTDERTALKLFFFSNFTTQKKYAQNKKK